jgi:hypothetical protein
MSSPLVNTLSNVLLSRPLCYGISLRPDQIAKKPTDAQQLYRLSSRFGYNGFRATAGERSSPHESAASTLKSARLRPWLLRPPVVPLNAMAIQHLLPSRKMVALNAGGLHYFGLHSVLMSLSDALMSAGPGSGGDKYVANLFTSFGYKEGCAMCVLLAIGFGPAAAGETQACEWYAKYWSSSRLLLVADSSGAIHPYRWNCHSQERYVLLVYMVVAVRGCRQRFPLAISCSLARRNL